MEDNNPLSSSKLSYTVDGASEATDIPKSTLWKYIREGKLETRKVGRRTLIPRDALQRLVMGDAA